MLAKNPKLYLVLISVHGLIRGEQLELGRDADTGGQTKYVVELAHALGDHPAVARVDLLTRQVVDERVSDDYAVTVEALADNVQIVRIACGETGYLPKEQLWDSLDSFADSAVAYLREQPTLPHVIHSHYADAGYVGARMVGLLGVPLVHTGHSLGRAKRRQLLAAGQREADLEKRYCISRRIAAEELTLGVADIVITSTHQEIEQQYGLYDYYQPERMRVIPPGTDLARFYPAAQQTVSGEIVAVVDRFLAEPHKPMILALSRPDPRKNIAQLLTAYGESPALQALANLVIVAGNRDDLRDMDDGAQEVLSDILWLIDKYDLYGKVAYPKHHQAEDVPDLYRLAAVRGGVFINPALTEPFGLTLIEAAACGVPIVATEDGGPLDIIQNCQNGYLIDPLDADDIASKLQQILADHAQWQRFSANGIAGVQQHYAWQAHANQYIPVVQSVLAQAEKPLLRVNPRQRLFHDRALFSSLDQNLMGSTPQAVQRLSQLLQVQRHNVLFGIATGRRFDAALSIVKRLKLPVPDVLITSLGTEIHYKPNFTPDTVWQQHIDYLWYPRRIRDLLRDVPGLVLQTKTEQSRFKISYFIDPTLAPDLSALNSLLHQAGLTANLTLSFGQFLDIVPIRASKGMALRWVAEKYSIPLTNVLAAGGSAGDDDMMRGNTLGVVVANRHDEELSGLANVENVFFATEPKAEGILQAIAHYDFFANSVEAAA